MKSLGRLEHKQSHTRKTPSFSREEGLLAFANTKIRDTGLLHQASRDCEDFQKQ